MEAKHHSEAKSSSAKKSVGGSKDSKGKLSHGDEDEDEPWNDDEPPAAKSSPDDDDLDNAKITEEMSSMAVSSDPLARKIVEGFRMYVDCVSRYSVSFI
jgi:hypothetical protein